MHSRLPQCLFHCKTISRPQPQGLASPSPSPSTSTSTWGSSPSPSTSGSWPSGSSTDALTWFSPPTPPPPASPSPGSPNHTWIYIVSVVVPVSVLLGSAGTLIAVMYSLCDKCIQINLFTNKQKNNLPSPKRRSMADLEIPCPM